jgi:hypothetical protein
MKVTTSPELTFEGIEVRPIAWAPGYYASRDGRVLSIRQWHRGIFALKGGNSSGYQIVTLQTPTGGVAKSIHRLVAEAFLPAPPESTYIVRHLDGDSQNNCVDNLAWGTQSENARDRFRHGKQTGARGESHPQARLTTAQVKEIRHRYDSGEAPVEIARHFPVSRGVVCNIGRRQSWKHLDD